VNTLTKLALGLIGHNRPRPVPGDAPAVVELATVQPRGGMPLLQALQQRQSGRSFLPQALSPETLSGLLWAVAGINRPTVGGRTAPSAINAQEIDLYVALPHALYRYAPAPHALHLVCSSDVRRVTGYQDFVDSAPLDLVYVADHSRMKLVPAGQRESYAWVAAGAMAQNAYLYCASAGLATVLRAWLDRSALSQAMGLDADHQVLLAQTVGLPAPH